MLVGGGGGEFGGFSTPVFFPVRLCYRHHQCGLCRLWVFGGSTMVALVGVGSYRQ
uniref:Uncharacterized protein n=1 Tax=Nelumbo nucifera TaxID=4432 RepID=A0A822YFN0_NELNU|nr:TPA_asm: hypothetical protein HUJ06_011835 [Nelumbo nucifera]